MIDLSDVSAALVSVIAAAIYPNGIGAASIITVPVRIMQGWPVLAQLEADLAAGYAVVSVYPSRMERNTTAYAQEWQDVSLNTPTLTESVSGKSVTIGGAVSAPQNVMIAVNNKPYIYGVQAGDTLAAIAAALAALISVDIAATAAGPVVTIANAIHLKSMIGVQGISARELKRQAKQFQICCWAGAHTLRDRVGAAVDIALAKMPRLPLPYGFSGHSKYVGSAQIDGEQKAGFYRRDLNYEVDYPTIEIATGTVIMGVQVNVLGAANFGDAPPNTHTVWTT